MGNTVMNDNPPAVLPPAPSMQSLMPSLRVALNDPFSGRWRVEYALDTLAANNALGQANEQAAALRASMIPVERDWLGKRLGTLWTTFTPVDGSGNCLLPIFPMLRISPNDSATCEFAQPFIEGSLGGNTVDVELAIAKATPASITITEIA